MSVNVSGWLMCSLSGIADAVAAARAAGAVGVFMIIDCVFDLTVLSVSREGGVAVVAVGDDTRSCGEGRDMHTLDLPGRQAELVNAVIDTGVATIVILSSGRAHSVLRIRDRAGVHRLISQI